MSALNWILLQDLQKKLAGVRGLGSLDLKFYAVLGFLFCGRRRMLQDVWSVSADGGSVEENMNERMRASALLTQVRNV